MTGATVCVTGPDGVGVLAASGGVTGFAGAVAAGTTGFTIDDTVDVTLEVTA